MPRTRTQHPLRRFVLAAVACIATAATQSQAGPADGIWSLVSPPKARFGQTVVHDPVRDRLILFGGSFSLSGANTTFRDVWTLELSGDPVWTNVVTSGTPPASRYGHSMVYDPVRDRLIVFGGYDNVGFFNDVWELSLSSSPAWAALSPTGTPPSGRYGQVAAYDPVGDRLLVFGGQTTGVTLLNDLWSLSLSGTPAWAPLVPAGTPPLTRRGASWVWDAARERLVLFGGYRGSYLDDVWSLPLTGTLAWTPLSPGGTGPGARAFHSATFDESRDEMVVYAGSNGVHKSDAFRLSFTGSPTWSALSPSGTVPMARSYHSAVRDPIRDRDIVFAGLSSILLSDLWALDRTESPSWAPIPASPTSPIMPRGYAAMVLDTARDRLLMFGGIGALGVIGNDLWELPLAEGGPFRPLAFTGTFPAPGFAMRHAAIYDPIRDRVLLFGGTAPGASRLWQLSLSGIPTWSELQPSGTLPPRRGRGSVVYDPSRDRILLFGGVNEIQWLSDTWSLDLATMTWSQVITTTVPSARYEHAAVWDPTHDRMVIFGGDPVNNDIWALGFTPTPSWSLVSSSLPSDRYGSVAVRDTHRDRMVIFGGSTDGSYPNDLSQLPLAPGSLPSALAPDGDIPHGRGYSSAVYDAARDRMLIFGGSSFDVVTQVWTYYNDLLSLQFSGIVGVPSGPGPSGPARLAAYPNPSRAHVDIAFSLAAEEHAQVRIHDVSGRLVIVVAERRFAAGPQALRWDRRTISGAKAPAGLYFLEVRAGRESFTRRLVLTN